VKLAGVAAHSLAGDIWRIYGYQPAEAIGNPISMLLPPSRKKEVIEIIDRLRAGERVEHFETTRVRKDGGVIDVSL
jgi:PAS domain S-box-containing protein